MRFCKAAQQIARKELTLRQSRRMTMTFGVALMTPKLRLSRACISVGYNAHPGPPSRMSMPSAAILNKRASVSRSSLLYLFRVVFEVLSQVWHRTQSGKQASAFS